MDESDVAHVARPGKLVSACLLLKESGETYIVVSSSLLHNVRYRPNCEEANA
jgi:hypothetical protein